MASMAIAASSMQIACSSHQVKKTQQPPSPKQLVRSIDTNKVSSKPHVLTLNIQGGQNGSYLAEQANNSASHIRKPENGKDDIMETGPRLLDDRWKNGTWDLNMFVKDGKIDWDGVIVAEARRRKFLEICPQASTNQEPVLFRTSIIPWWAWLKRSHLPEAELINGRAAMVGFFMAYLVDVLTRLDMVGQTGNFVCKAGMFVTVVGVILFRRSQDFDSLKKLADEATFYDKQWRLSWQDHNASNSTQGKKK